MAATKTIFSVKSVIVSRKPLHNKEGAWAAFIGLFDENNPHLSGKVPFKVVEISNVEKVRIRDLRNISFYLLGNDVVINNLKKIAITKEDSVVTLTGTQELPK